VVAPYMGAWIEITCITQIPASDHCRSLHGSVD